MLEPRPLPPAELTLPAESLPSAELVPPVEPLPPAELVQPAAALRPVALRPAALRTDAAARRSAGPGPLLRFTTAAMVAADLGFLAYWALIIAHALPAQVMFAEYADPRVAAWNWSFLPLDLAASLTGLSAVRALRRTRPSAPALLSVSLTLTAVAGGLAVAYFAQRGQFDPLWMLPNLALLLFPLPLLIRLGRTGLPCLGT